MAKLEEVLEFDDKADNLKRRKDELENMGEGKPGAPGSTKTKKEAVERAQKAKGGGDVGDPVRTGIDGRKYRPSDLVKESRRK